MLKISSRILHCAAVPLLLAASPIAAQSPARNAALQEVVRAERGFAAMSREKGMREAFLTNLAEDGLVFRPGPVNGRSAYLERTSGPELLTWQPSWADVAESGDMGFTTGPYEFRAGGAADTTVGRGHYVTVWKRSADGVWKAALDIGTPHPSTGQEEDLRMRTTGDRRWADAAGSRASLLRADSLLGAGGGTERAALAPLMTAETRLHRSGVVPVTGVAAATPHLEGDIRAWASKPLGGGTASSGDFGFTYGSVSRGAAGGEPSEYYLRIWRRRPSGDWYLVLDLASGARR